MKTPVGIVLLSRLVFMYVILACPTGILAQNAPVTTAATITNAVPGQQVTVPVTVTAFNNIGSVTLTLDYDYSKIRYVSFTKNPAFSGFFSVGDNNLGNGYHRLVLGWFGNGLTLPNGSYIVNYKFTYITGSTALTWFDMGPSCEYTNDNADVLNDIPYSSYYINGFVGDAPPLVADFTASTTYAAANETITLTDLTTGGPTGWNWSISPATYTFVNGTSATSQNPQVQFTTNGAYSVTLVASRGTTTSTKVKNNYLFIGSHVFLNCPNDQTVAACQAQAAVNTAYTNWLASATSTCACNCTLTNNSTGPPPACGGSKTVTWTLTSDCEAPLTCTKTFTVTDAPAVTFNCASDKTEAACQTQAAINASFNTWLTTTTASGGCNGSLTRVPASPVAPLACGGSTTVTWTYTSSCGVTQTCTKTFTVSPAPAVTFTCASDKTEAACQGQAAINASFAAWLLTTTASGGCNGVLSKTPANPVAPAACGGATTVTWNYSSSCGTLQSCTKTFTVLPAPAVTFTCAADKTEATCQDQAAIDASFAAWLLTTTASGGCNGTMTTVPASPVAPSACGGATTVTWNYSSSCGSTQSCTKTFTVLPEPAVTFACATDVTEVACQGQTAIDASFALWLLTTTASGGCNGTLATLPDVPVAPLACGGSTSVTWNYTTSCGVQTCTRTFTVTPAPAVIFNCAADKTEAACQNQAAIDASFAAWLLTTTASGGCNGAMTTVPSAPAAPLACGGSTTVTWNYTTSCGVQSCTRTFTVIPAPAVVFNCAAYKTETACQGQAAIDASFAAWLLTTTASGGCNGILETIPTSPVAPSACGGTTSVTWNYTSSCGTAQTCTRSFSVTAAPAVTFTCADDKTEAACQGQAAIDASFAAWLTTTTASGGCNGILETIPASPVAPPACGGSTAVIWNYTSSCGIAQSCTKTFTVAAAPAVTITCADDKTEAACQDQAAIDASFTAWLLTTTASGGCNGILATVPASPVAPSACGGTTFVTWNYTSTCGTVQTCTRSFSVTPAPSVTFTCADDRTEAACQDQAAIDASFAAWLLTTTANGGCNGTLSMIPATPLAPLACGGSTTVTWNYTSSCDVTKTCTKTFTVDAAPAVTFTCAADKTEAACQGQSAIDASFAAWLLTTTATGGCNGVLVTDPVTPSPPLASGGSTTVTWNFTSSCGVTQTCTRTFTVTSGSLIVFNCASNKIEIACQTQEAINTSFAAWLLTTTASGCSGTLTTEPVTPVAPLACGGSTEVTWTYTTGCEDPYTCTRTFTVSPAPAVDFICGIDKTEAACQTQSAIDASFAAWLLTTTAVGGCNGTMTTVPAIPAAPSACGGSVIVTWNYTSTCGLPQTCTKTFTVQDAPAISFSCAIDKTEAACQSQSAIDASFAAWLLTTTASGGCNGTMITDPAIPLAPSACGGTTTVTWNYNSSCDVTRTCTRSFTVDPAPAVVFNCAADKTEAACQTQAVIEESFAAWLATANASGGCNGSFTRTPALPVAPSACGGFADVTWTYTSSCAPFTTTCTKRFTVSDAPAVVFNCASDKTEPSCQSQDAINTSFGAWLLTTTASGGCNGILTTVPATPVAPPACGGLTSVTWNYTTSCGVQSCTKTFTVDAAPAVVFNCGTDKTEAACQSQEAINTSFTAWLLTTTASGGCNGTLSMIPATPVAPLACGGSTTVTWNYTSSCDVTTTCTKTFTVNPAPAVVFNCGIDKTEAACQTQSAIDASFAAWLLTTTASGGCNGILSTIPAIPAAPLACGGSATVTWNYSSSCDIPMTCTKTFTVDPAPAVVFNCGIDKTEAACQSQSAIDSKFAAWLGTTLADGGCNGTLVSVPAIPAAPSACGGFTAVTWNYTSTCGLSQTCTKTFTVLDAPAVSFTCAVDQTEAACQTQAAIDSKFAAWLGTTLADGGCNGSLVSVPAVPAAPSACGGFTTVTWNYTSTCGLPQTCTKTFTVTEAPAVSFTCAVDQTEAACQTQAAIDSKFAAWLGTTLADGGCNGTLVSVPAIPAAPSACGGFTAVTWNYTSTCGLSQTCTKTFTVLDAPAVSFTCAVDQTEAACQTQAAIDSKFAAWLGTTLADGGCNGSLVSVPAIPAAPSACGGFTTVTWNYTSTCGLPQTCTKTFTVTEAPAVSFTCAVDQTEAACQTQAAIDSKFAAWLGTTLADGGCNGTLVSVPAVPAAPSACGGFTTVTWNYTSTCGLPQTCTKTFTVTEAPAVSFTCAVDQTEAACQTQAVINASYASWLLTTTASGGCDGILSMVPATPVAPLACGGSTTVTWNYSSSCDIPMTCTKTFTVDPAPAVVFNCGIDKTEAACQAQSAIDASFAAWLLTTTASGGCNGILTTVPATPVAPLACGGSTTVTWNYSSSCEDTKTCTKTFTVTTDPAILVCGTDVTVSACQSQNEVDAAYAQFLASATASGGCSGSLTNNAPANAPDICGGFTDVTWTYTTTCEAVSCNRRFSVSAPAVAALSCPSDFIMEIGQTQSAVDAAYSIWLASVSASGGCNATLANDGTGAPSADGGSVTVTFTYTSSGCVPATLTCSATFMVAVTNTISGTLKYNNSGETPMSNVTLRLQKFTIPEVDVTTSTIADGSYTFGNLCAGIYTITPTITMAPDEINSTDAALANSWGANTGPIEYVKFLAGDVMDNDWINAADAHKIQRHFVFGDAFDKAPWSCWKKGDIINSNWDPEVKPVNFDVTLNGTDVTNYDLYAQCTGDFNGSFIPGAKAAHSSLVLTYGGNTQIGPNQEFELPLRALTAMEAGAVSLILEIPSDLVEVTGVSVNGSDEPVAYMLKGNELRISWYSEAPVTIPDNGSLVVLNLRTTGAFTPGQSIKINLTGDALNELADESYNEIEAAVLVVDIVKNLSSGTGQADISQLTLGNYPNPFSKLTTVSYSIPYDGKVVLEVYTLLGQHLSTLVNENQPAGTYSLKFDGEVLQQGIYLVRLRFSDEKVNITRAMKIIVSK